jgi:hypothetical protein
MNMRNFLKLAAGVTFLHILFIRVPGMFEEWFGDKLSAGKDQIMPTEMAPIEPEIQEFKKEHMENLKSENSDK